MSLFTEKKLKEYHLKKNDIIYTLSSEGCGEEDYTVPRYSEEEFNKLGLKLDEKTSCTPRMFDMYGSPITVDAYKKKSLYLPEWMDSDAWIDNRSEWNALWDSQSLCLMRNEKIGECAPYPPSAKPNPNAVRKANTTPIIAMDKEWQKKLVKIDSAQQKMALSLLRKNQLKEGFNLSLRDQAEQWLNDPNPKYNRPFSPKQVSAFMKYNYGYFTQSEQKKYGAYPY